MTKKTSIEEELAQNVDAVLNENFADTPKPPPGALGNVGTGPSAGTANPTPHPYIELQRIMTLAYQQAASGKGKQRHAFGPVGFRPWHDQPILVNARQVGPGGPALQVMKKMQEATGMAGNGNYAGARAEALGAMVYAAAFFKLVEEMEAAASDPNPAE